jgi:hypothetical protein
MATTQSFQDMLNENLNYPLLKEELLKRNFLLSKVEKQEDWMGGTLPVPFKAAGASSVAFGSLTDEDNISQDKFVRGEVSGYREAWGTMVFNQRDLMEHGRVSEQNFLKILPEAIEDFMDHFKMVVSVNLLNGAHFATLTADGDASGNITVDRPDRFMIGQQVTVKDDNTAATDAFVNSIVSDTGVVNLVTTRGGATPANLSAYTVDQNAKCYNEGADEANKAFSSLRDALLSLANGGSTTLYGQTKTAYPYLQAINVDGSDVTAANILEKIFDALTRVRMLGKGAPTDVLMSWNLFSHCIKAVESQKGAFNVVPDSSKATEYGWEEIRIGTVSKVPLKLVGIQEMDDDIIMFIDWRALKFHTNGFFRKNKSPDGNEYYVKRATTGYRYIVDICLYGELVVSRPSYCGIMHSIDI